MEHWKHTEAYLTCLKEHMFLLFVYLRAHVLSGIWLDLFKKAETENCPLSKSRGKGGEVAQSNLVN